ncbi:hypothetical protein [Pelosinus sp. UFO1]|uniref:hypothetical protein n=1 Tax=Pelosinus sp. UFO1 TaxID=484770 RepID=UPI001F47BD0D|nr:hypothetical protein [Pelosinus sp. UFO1]
MYNGRAKTAMGAEVIGVGRCREIATGSVGICGSRAKVSIGCVMLVGSRKIAYRYVMIGIGCSVDHYGLFFRLTVYSVSFYFYLARSPHYFL